MSAGIRKYINPYNLFVGSFIPNWLLRRNEISPGGKLCYARLAQFAGKDGECFPSQATLAAEIGAGERQVRRYISELEKQGLIDTIQVGLNHQNRYRFLWHRWMEEGGVKKLSGKKGKGRDRSDRTYKSIPERTDSSLQEWSDKSIEENQLRDSLKTTTGSVVVDNEKIDKVKKALAPVYLGMPDTVIADLIKKKGVEHILSIADQTAYQFKHKSKAPENPTGHFIALTLKGMNTPEGYQSPQEIARAEKAALMEAALRRKKNMRDQKERISREQLREFIELLGGNNDGAKRSL
jgi:DNA-binding Lrp family transcriptional regulator